MVSVYEVNMYVLAKTNLEDSLIPFEGLEGRFSFSVEHGYPNRVTPKSPVLWGFLGSYELNEGSLKTSDLQRMLSEGAKQYSKKVKGGNIAVIVDLGEQDLPLVLKCGDTLPEKLDVGLGAKVEFYSTRL